MNDLEIVIPCALLAFSLLIIAVVVIALKRKAIAFDSFEHARRLLRRYRIVCVTTAICAVILFVVAITIIAVLQLVIVGMAIIVCVLWSAGVSGFCFGKVITISTFLKNKQ